MINKTIAKIYLFLLFLLIIPKTAYGNMCSMELIYNGEVHSYLEREVKISVEDIELSNMDIPPIILQGRTMVPVRAVFEAMGAEVIWDSKAKEITIAKNDNTINLKIDRATGIKNGNEFILDVPPTIINKRAMIPVRGISEALDCTVNWDHKARLVSITNNNNEEEVVLTTDNSESIEPSITEVDTNKEVNKELDLKVAGKNENTILIANEDIESFGIKIPKAEKDIQSFIYTCKNEIEKYDVVKLNDGNVAIVLYNEPIDNLGEPIEINTSPYIKAISKSTGFTSSQEVLKVIFELKAPSTYKASLSEDKRSIELIFEADTGSGNSKYYKTISVGDTDYVIFNKIGLPTIEVNYLINPYRAVIEVPSSNRELEKEYSVSGLKNVTKITTETTNLDTRKISLEIPEGSEIITKEYNGNSLEIVIDKPSIKNIHYNNNTITLAKSEKEIALANITTVDDYNNNKYNIVLDGDYSEVYGHGRIICDDEFVSGIKVTTDLGRTSISIYNKKLMATRIHEDNENIYIDIKNPKEVYSLIVVIDAGHGDKDYGAINNGIIEKELNLDIALRVKKYLEGEPSIKAYLTRETDIYPQNIDRAVLANKIGDMLLSIHHNSSDRLSAKGTETLYYARENEGEEGFTGKNSAKIIHYNLCKELETLDRGLKDRPDLIVLNQSKVPAVLIEGVFLSNSEDAKKIADEKYRDKEAYAIYISLKEIDEKYGR